MFQHNLKENSTLCILRPLKASSYLHAPIRPLFLINFSTVIMVVTNNACTKTGATQCQDGVTNNCTQGCTRDNITGVHKCSCQEGFDVSSGSESECKGNNYIILMVHRWMKIIIMVYSTYMHEYVRTTRTIPLI